MLSFFQDAYLYFLNNPYEFWGVITSIICVWLNARENVWAWFFAIIAAGLYIKIFYDIRLIGDLLLQIIFIILSFYGAYEWLFGKTETGEALQVSLTPKSLLIPLGLIFIASTLLIAQLLKFLNGDIVYVDAATTSISLIAQWMMARKYLANWLVWILVDFIYVGVYAYKEVYLTSFLYFIFLFLATWGYFKWRKVWKEQASNSAEYA